MVQWWRLDPSERIADESVSRLLAEQLATYDTVARRNENHLIASRLAVRLGQERVYPTDDQCDDVVPNFEANIDAFMEEPWIAQLMEDPGFTPLREAPQHLTSAAEALATYRMLNGPARRPHRRERPVAQHDQSRRAQAMSAARAWRHGKCAICGRSRTFARSSARHPGGRILVIVGSAHKPWFDAYLSMMSDVQIVDATRVLR